MKKLVMTMIDLLLMAAIVVVLEACSSDDSKVMYSISNPELALEYGEEKQIDVIPSLEGFQFSSDNNRIASVDITGKVYAGIAGETFINVVNANANFIGKVKVTVTPTYTMFKDPCLNFGCSRSEVESYEGKAPDAEEGTSIAYRGQSSDVLMVVYMFTGGRLSATIVVFPYTSRVLDNMYEHLKQRYSIQVTSDGEIIVSGDKKVGGLIEHFYEGNTHFERVMFLPFPN